MSGGRARSGERQNETRKLRGRRERGVRRGTRRRRHHHERAARRHATRRCARRCGRGLLPQIARMPSASAKPDHTLADVKFLPVIPNPGADRLRRHQLPLACRPRPAARLPKQPSMFIRLTDTLVGHDGEMIRPRVSHPFRFRGRACRRDRQGGRHIPKERALDHVAGYTCFVDGSVRDYQKFSVTSGKNFPGTGPLGPWIVTTDEIPDPTKPHADHAAQRPGGAAAPAPIS